MNPEKRQTLREEHSDASWWDNPGCSCCEYTLVGACTAGCFDYPCDVIELLDALEQAYKLIEGFLETSFAYDSQTRMVGLDDVYWLNEEMFTLVEELMPKDEA